MERRDAINHFLVDVFNEILKTEEVWIVNQGFANLSIREMHVIEAVCKAEQKQDNRATAIAEKLRITAGTLTTAVTILEKKGYLTRHKDEKDKRIVRILPTEAGRQANACHAVFHVEMVNDILNILDEEEQTILLRALGGISTFFRAKNKGAMV